MSSHITRTAATYTLSLHDALPIWFERALGNDFRIQATGILRRYRNYSDRVFPAARWTPTTVTNQLTGQPVTVYKWANRSEEHTSELQSHHDLVCRLLLEKKKQQEH